MIQFESLLLAPLAALVCAPLLSAQTSTKVLPPNFASVEGDSYTSFPFGRSGSVRAQLYYSSTWIGGKMRVGKVAFRPEGQQTFASKKVELEIKLATGPATSSALSSDFSKNRGRDAKTAFAKKTVSLPSVTSASGPRPFFAIALDVPFDFDSNAGGLLVELIVHGQQRGRWDLDVGSKCTSARTKFGLPGCKGSNGLVPQADVPTQALLHGQRFAMRVRNLKPSMLCAMLIGTRESGNWMGLTLPFRLDAIGARSCALNTDIVFVIGSVANSNGEASVLGALPRLERLVGEWFRFQGMVLDSRANALGLSFSNGSKTQVCGPLPVGRVLSTSLTARLGTLELGRAPVLQVSTR